MSKLITSTNSIIERFTIDYNLFNQKDIDNQTITKVPDFDS